MKTLKEIAVICWTCKLHYKAEAEDFRVIKKTKQFCSFTCWQIWVVKIKNQRLRRVRRLTPIEAELIDKFRSGDLALT